MKVLLRWVGLGFSSAKDTQIVDLSRVPGKGEEIHWLNKIAEVTKTVHFPLEDGGENPQEIAGCCFVAEVS